MEIIFALLLPLPLSVSPLAWLSFHSGYPVARPADHDHSGFFTIRLYPYIILA